jgi:hypothetical protein
MRARSWIRGIVVATMALVILLMASWPAAAMCTPGRIGVDPRTGKVTVELPRCNPPPQ